MSLRSPGTPAPTAVYGAGSPPLRVLLVGPRHPRSFWSMQGTVDLFGARTLMPNAALATLMALTPDDVPVEYRLMDENVGPVDLQAPCDLAAVTGSTLHGPRIEQLCRAFRSRGVPVALGGTFATLRPERCQDLADHLFLGEAELTWPRFLQELRQGRAGPRYEQREHVDLALSPAPDWSLIRPEHYIHIQVQTSRGCPNRCDFCDAVQYLGRRYRTKSVAQILTELRNIHGLGHTSIFFSDDNFLGNPLFTRELLPAIIAWNTTLEHPVSLSTQITMQVADDEELLHMMADARFSVLFLGLETTRRESLAEIHKVHNLRHDPVERLRRISRFGLVPFVGLIVGFDSDDAAIFAELEAFLEQADAPIAGISLLNAPRNTPLYERLRAEGRLEGEDFSGEWQLRSNVVPLRMSKEQLLEGYWGLYRRIYEPRRFEARLQRWLDGVQHTSTGYTRKRTEAKQYLKMARVLRYCLLQAEPELRAMFLRSIARGLRKNPRLLTRLFTFLGQYRHFYDFVQQSSAITDGTPAGRSPR